MSYNIQDGGRWRLPLIARVIRQQQPDVVALLEATNRWAVEGLARSLGMRVAFGRANNAFHVAWLSRLPIARQVNHRAPGLAKTMLEITVAWGGQPLQLFATHLAAGSDRLHPAQEAPVIVERLRAVARGPHLLVGDLNALHPADVVGTPPPTFVDMHRSIDGDPRQAIREVLAEGYVDCFRALHPDLPGYSYPAATPWLRIDYIFASSEMAGTLRACDVIDGERVRRASDHLPVAAMFAAPPQPLL